MTDESALPHWPGHPAGTPDQWREQAALARAMAATERENAAYFAELAAKGLADAEMAERSLRAASGLEQLASLHAAQALAYEEMMAAGGPSNARAYAEYEATTHRNIALYPGADSFDR